MNSLRRRLARAPTLLRKTSMSVRKQSLSTEGELFLFRRWPGFRRTAGAFRRRFASSRNPVFHHCHSAELKRIVVGLPIIAGCPHEKFSAVRQGLDQGGGVRREQALAVAGCAPRCRDGRAVID